MTRHLILAALAFGFLWHPAQTPTTHRIEATPATVAYGHY